MLPEVVFIAIARVFEGCSEWIARVPTSHGETFLERLLNPTEVAPLDERAVSPGGDQIR
jgi:hypothetical protein